VLMIPFAATSQHKARSGKGHCGFTTPSRRCMLASCSAFMSSRSISAGARLHTLPGLAAMFVFFVASSVGPLITRGEACRHLRAAALLPVTVNTLILGDVVAGMLYGIIINIIILAAGTAAFGYAVASQSSPNRYQLLLGAFCFSALGVLSHLQRAQTPPMSLMLSARRFPLIFIRHICAIASLQGRKCVYCSPITYLVNGFDLGLLEAPRSRSCWVGRPYRL